MTLVEALIDQGRYEEAFTALTNLSQTRDVAVKADADEASAHAARNEMENILGRPITVPLRPGQLPRAGVNGYRAAGGPMAAGGAYVVGEQGPEIITPGTDSYVTPNSALARSGGGVATRPSVVNNNFTITTLDAYAIERHIRQRLKWTGSNWLGDLL